ncbi:hypothetical protein WAI453_009617 [Rhynchosporium graminicola]
MQLQIPATKACIQINGHPLITVQYLIIVDGSDWKCLLIEVKGSLASSPFGWSIAKKARHKSSSPDAVKHSGQKENESQAA